MQRADVIDLSHWDDVTDAFAGTKRMGVLGVINKVTEARNYVDPSFNWRRAPAARAGLLYGAYHFLRPGDPAAQAGYFLDHVGDPKGLRLALDHEDPNVSVDSARKFLEAVHRRIGWWCHYYSYQSFILDRESQYDRTFWARIPLWLAAYNMNPKWPQRIWPHWDTWQFTGDGNGPLPHQVPGIRIAGGCDINQAYDRDALAAKWATIQGSEPVPVPEPQPPSPVPIPPLDFDPSAIMRIADASEIAHYHWSDRGLAPRGYTRGMAVTFSRVYRKLKAADPSATLMARANTHNATSDALSWYAGVFNSKGMPNDASGADTLRHLFVLLLGLGMRESSGIYTEGRDTTASNTTSDTAEAGLFQQSWNSHVASPEIRRLLDLYDEDNVDGLRSVFAADVTRPISPSFGTGLGRAFQVMCKTKPAFAVEAAAVGLRTIRAHWGPINRYEVEVRAAADAMFKQVQDYIDGAPAMVA